MHNMPQMYYKKDSVLSWYRRIIEMSETQLTAAFLFYYETDENFVFAIDAILAVE